MDGTVTAADPLEPRIQHWIAQGYRVTVRTPTTAQMVRPRHFNPLEFVAMPIYLIEYLGQKDRLVYLSLEDGAVRETGNAVELTRMARMQARSLPERLLISVGILVAVGVVLTILGYLMR